MLDELKQDLLELRDQEKAAVYARFFKTDSGEYGEGDTFLGLTVPQQRKVAKGYDLSLKDIGALLDSNIHEYRFTALVILVRKYEESIDKKTIVDFYLRNVAQVNNWDLVDTSAPYILGDYLLENDRMVLYELARSTNLWQRRIAILSTFAFIKHDQFEDTLRIAEILLHDKHDLIHKAVGWMLREVGKKDQEVEEGFLRKHYRSMPRMMLRYAIERFDEGKRKYYMKKA